MKISHRSDESVNDILEPKSFLKENSLDLDHGFMKLGLKKVKNRNRFKPLNLEETIKKYKVQVLKNNFISKTRLNSIYRTPIEETNDQHDRDENDKKPWQKVMDKLEEIEGLSLGSTSLAVWSIINIIQISLMVFIFSIMMVFAQTSKIQIFLYFRIFSVTLYIIDMIMNSVTQRFQAGKQLHNIRQIIEFYLKNGFFIDLCSILIFPIDMLIETNIAPVMTIMAIIKLTNNIKRLQKFEYIYINSNGKEQYYGLIKVFVTNFVIGHILSILLNLMTNINQTQNWYYKANIQDSQWYTKYIWGYYWGTNIMLTVGFGDLAASNQLQAILLIFIQTFSCITLAYNISYVGALIGQIRAQSEEKRKKLKYFHRMCQQNEIPSQLETKFTNFIEQSYEIKENFQYDEHDQVLESLPKDMQIQYRKQANKLLFDGLGFLNYLSRRSMLKMAELVERKICHPDEIILKKGDPAELMILQNGTIGFLCRTTSPHSDLNGKHIESLTVKEGQKAKAISLDFIKNKKLNYDLKSKKYSIIYSLSIQNFKQALKSFEIDYQLFCMLRDRDEYLLDENNLYLCQYCKDSYHNKFQCPKLHYKPLKQMVIYKYLHKQKNRKMKGIKIKRKKFDHKCLKNAKKVQVAQFNFIKNNLDEDEQLQISRLKDFHEKYLPLRLLSGNKLEKGIKQTMKFQDLAMNKIQNILKMNQQQEFWDLELDEAFNYKYYFMNDNPEKFEKTKKKKHWKKKN